MPRKKKPVITTMELKQGTPEWRAIRSQLLTGSRIAAALGVSPFQTREGLLQEMCKEAIGIFVNASNPMMQWGNDHEEEARSAASFQLGMAFEVPGFVTNSAYPMLGYSPDGIHWDNRLLLELKCPWGIRNDNPPVFKELEDLTHYWHQCQMGMLVCDLDEAWLIQWTPYGLHDIHIPRDPDYWSEIREAVESFCAELADRLADDEYMDTLSMRDDREWLLATEDFKMAKQLADHAAAKADEAKARLLELAPRGGHGNGVKVSRVVTKGRVDYAAAIKKLVPEADLAPFTKPDSESLRVTISKE